jgi:hypothetical protein
MAARIDPVLARQALFAQGVLHWYLHAGQLEAYKLLRSLPPHVRQRVLEIARRWGKSVLGVVMALEDALSAPNGQVLYCAPTLKQASSIIVPLIRDVLMHAPHGLVTRTKSEYRWNCANGSSVILGGFDTASESFRGLRATSIFCDESGSADPDEFLYTVRSILLPTLLHSRGPITHLTTPSPLPAHPLHDEIIPECQLNNAHFVRTVYDNPLVDSKTIEQFKKDCGGEESDAWKREFLCQRVISKDAIVVPEFDLALHVSPHEPSFANWLVATDFGGVRDKTVGLLVAYDFERNSVHFLNEFVADSNTGTGTIVAGLRALERYECDRVVDAPGQLLIDLTTTHGYLCRQTPKDNWLAQINLLRNGFRQGQVFVHPRCQFLIATLKAATFNKTRTDFNRTTALGHMDAIAAATYGYRSIDRVTNPIPRGTPSALDQVESFWQKQEEHIEQRRNKEWWDLS